MKTDLFQSDRGWDGWMASPIWQTWVWVSSRSWWWTWKPGVLQSLGSQRVRHDWATELNWNECLWESSMLLLISEVHFSSLLNTIPLYGTQPFIHSPVDSHLDCFYLLVIINSATVNILLVVRCYRLSFLTGEYLRRISRSGGKCIIGFYKKMPIFQSRYTIFNPTSNAK